MKRDHPPFRRRGDAMAYDGLSREGARILAQRIRTAWAECGYEIEPVVEPLALAGAGWVVRIPQLIGGLPASLYHARARA
jgi:hypothetical protein